MAEPLKGLELFIDSATAVAGAKAFAEAADRAAAAAEKYAALLDRVDAALAASGMRAAESGAKVASAGDGIKKTGDEAARAAPKVSSVGKATEDAGRRASEASKHVTFFGRAMATLGLTSDKTALLVARFGTAIASFLAVRRAVNVIGEAEDAMRVLGAVTDATSAQLRAMDDAATALSLSTRFRFTEGVTAMTELGRAGLDSRQAIEALPVVSDFARAGLISLDDAVQKVVATMAQFELGTDQATRIVDTLSYAARVTATDVPRLTSALAKVGPIGATLGIELETVVGLLAQLQHAGVQAQISGRGLASILGSLASPTKEAKEALRQLGFSFEDIRAIPGDVVAAFQRLGREQITLAQATNIVGEEFDALLLLLANAGPRSADLIERLFTKAMGDSALQAAAQVGTLRDELAGLGIAADRFFLEAGDAGLTGALAGLTRVARDTLLVLSGNEKAMEKAGAAGHIFATAIKDGAVALAAYVAAQAALRVEALVSSFIGATAAITATEVATRKTVVVMSRAERAFNLLALTIRNHPIAALASALGAATAAFFIFGDSAEESTKDMSAFEEAAKRAAATAEQFADVRKRLATEAPDVGVDKLTGATKELAALVRSTLLEVEQLGLLELEPKGITPILNVVAAIEQKAPAAAARLRALIDELRGVDSFQKSGSDIALKFDEMDRAASQLGITVTRVFDGEKVAQFGVQTTEAIRILSGELNRLTGDARAADRALRSAAEAREKLANAARAPFDDAIEDISEGLKEFGFRSKAAIDGVRALGQQLFNLRSFGLKEVPVTDLLDGIKAAAPQAGEAMAKLIKQIEEAGDVGKQLDLLPRFRDLATQIEQVTGIRVFERVKVGVDGVATRVAGFFVDVAKAAFDSGVALDRLTGGMNEANRAIFRTKFGAAGLGEELKNLGAAGVGTEMTRKLGDVERGWELIKAGARKAFGEILGGFKKEEDAVSKLLREKRQEAAASVLGERNVQRLTLLQEVFNLRKQEAKKLTLDDLRAIELTVRAMERGRTAGDQSERRAAASEIVEKLEQENALLRVQGPEREALRATQQAEAEIAALKVQLTTEENAEVRALLDERLKLLEAEKARVATFKQERRDDKRQRQLIRDLEQEVDLVGASVLEWDRLRRAQQAANAAREAGLTDAEVKAYVDRKMAVEDYVDAVQEGVTRMQEFGAATTAALEDALFVTNDLSEAMRNLLAEILRISFRQVVGGGIQNLSAIIGQGLAGLFGGGPPSQGGPPGRPGVPDPGSLYPQQLGGVWRHGVVPAQGGRLIDEMTIFRRGRQAVSVSEGGSSTPEGIFPVVRDSRGRLGISAEGAGGGDTFIMQFPSVRNRDDARGLRTTMMQRAKKLAVPIKRARGMRP